MIQKYNIQRSCADTVFNIMLFLISPALSIISTIIYAYRQRYEQLTILSLSIAMVSLITPPFADIYRHTLLYFLFEHYAWSGFFQSNDHDFIFYTLTHLFAKQGIPFEFISFLFVFTCYQISFYLFKKLINNDIARTWSSNIRFIVFLCFLFMVPFVAIINGLRMATAAYIGVLGWYFIYRHIRFRGIIIYIIACCMHFGAMLFLPLMISTLFKKLNITRGVFIIGAFILLISGNILLRVMPQEMIMAVELEDEVTGYMINSEERFDDTMSFNGFIAMFLERLPLCVIGIILLLNTMRFSTRERSLMYITILTAVLYFPFTVLFQRFAFFAIPLLIFLALLGTRNLMQQRLPIIIMLSCVIMTLSYGYGYRNVVAATPYYKMLYPSAYTIITTDTHENFRSALIPKN